MPVTATKPLNIDFSSFVMGLNTRDPHTAIKDNQAYKGTQNARFKKSGIEPWFGFWGIKEAPIFASRSQGLDIRSRVSGSDELFSYAAGKVYRVDKNTAEQTELYDLTQAGKYNSGECWGVSFYDKFFVTNGYNSCVIEDDTGYPIGIAPPVAVVMKEKTGGEMPSGVYTVYAAYARTQDGSRVQYSTGQNLGTVTLGSGKQSIQITNFQNSPDPRVHEKIIFATEADQEVVYLLYSTGDNTTTDFVITDEDQKNVSVLYRIVSDPSLQPPAMNGLFAFSDRLFGWKDNVLHASKQAVTVYDLECWPGYTYTFPFQITGLFSIGEDLFIMGGGNGTFKLPAADMAAAYVQVSKRIWFKYPRTVANTDENFKETNSPVIGVTNDGVRIFDGVNFSPDLTLDIKDQISDLYTGSSAVYPPCGIVYRAFDRTEYRLSYRDLDVNSEYNNSTFVLNLDELLISGSTVESAPWEFVSVGFQYAVVDISGTLFMVQSLEGASHLFKEILRKPTDKWIYNGTEFLTAETPKPEKVITKMVIPDIAGRIRLDQVRYLSHVKSSGTITVYVSKDEDEILNEATAIDTGTANAPRWGSFKWGIDKWASEKPVVGVIPLGEDIKGVACYVVVEINSERITDFLSELRVIGTYSQGKYQ